MTELPDGSCFRFDHYVKEDQAFSHQGVTPLDEAKARPEELYHSESGRRAGDELAGGSRYWRPRDRSHTDDLARRDLNDL
jgi:hypothetical protein